MKKTIVVIGVITLTLSSCVSKKKYTELMTEKNNITTERDNFRTENTKQIAQIEALKNKKMDLNSEIDKVSYALGVNIGNSIKAQGLTSVNSEAFATALDATFNGVTPQISMQQSQEILQTYFGRLQAKQTEAAQKIGKEFLAENAKKEGVVVLPSGLQYVVITKGTGTIPKSTDKVKTHYHGTLIDGTVFDSSVERNSPATFPVTGVIQGWIEALQLMPVGSKWKLFIPSDLAYGERGQGSIQPHSTLIFEIELLEIVK